MIPYNESYAVQFGEGCNEVYQEANTAPVDPGMISVHSTRAAWDYYVGGLSWDAAYKKHINEFRAEYGLPPTGGGPVPPEPPPAGDVLPLRIDGQFFVTDAGPHVVIATSDFWLFGHYCAGEDITPVLTERQGLGFNECRVFLSMNGGLGIFDPRPHVDKLPAFCDLLAAYGLRVELTVFADTQRWLPSEADQRTLFQQVVSLVRGRANVRLEGVNEFDNKTNAAPGIVNETAEGVCWALASMTQDNGTKTPVKNYGTYHPARQSDWPRKVGHNAMEDVANKYHIPATSNECKRPDEDGYKPSNFFDAAANASLLCAGACFHSNAGKASTLFTPQELTCAQAWVAGALAVPLKYRVGHYTRGGLSDCPIKHDDKWCSRTHVRILGNESCCEAVQRNANWKLIPVPPWQLVSQTESVIELRK